MSVRSFQQIADEADAVAKLGVKMGYWLGALGPNGREEVNGLTIGSVYHVSLDPGYVRRLPGGIVEGGYFLVDDDGDERHRPDSEFKIVG